MLQTALPRPTSYAHFALLALLVACSSGPSGSTPTGLTVSGKVLDTNTGQPAAFLPVMVGGKVTSTDAAGSFSATSVVSPYELVILQPAQKYAQVYEGVTRTDPIVLVYVPDTTPVRKATLTVNFTGTGTGTGLMDVGNPVRTNGGVSGSVATPGSSYTTTLQWNGSGPSSFEGSVCAILSQNTGQVATAITSYGQRDQVYVHDGQPTTTTVVMSPVPTKTISGTVSAPPGYSVNAKTLGYVCGSTSSYPSYPFTFDMGAETSFSYVTPAIPTTFYVGASAKKGDSYLSTQQFDVAPDASGINLILPVPAELNAPASNAVGLTSPVHFTWSPPSTGVNQVYINPTTPGPLGFTVYSPNASLTLPDLGALGYAAPKGTTYKWSVGADSRVPNVNAALSGVPLNYLTTYASSASASRQFTTAP